MQELTSLMANLQHRAVAAVTTVTIQTLQDVQVSLVEVTTTLTEETGIQAAAHLVTIPVQLVTAELSVLALQLTVLLPVAAVAVRRQVLLLLQVKVEAHQAAVGINS